jgi:hypothetical protein
MEKYSFKQLAKEYGLDHKHTYRIILGSIWRHLPIFYQKIQLTPKDALVIRDKYHSNDSDQKQLSEEYGVSRAAISKIITRKNFPNLPMSEIEKHSTRKRNK